MSQCCESRGLRCQGPRGPCHGRIVEESERCGRPRAVATGRNYLEDYNENPKPFVWIKAVDEILKKPSRLSANLVIRTLEGVSIAQLLHAAGGRLAPVRPDCAPGPREFEHLASAIFQEVR